MTYKLRGPLPAGPYKLKTYTFAAGTTNAVMHFDVVHRAAGVGDGGAETVIVTFDSAPTVDGGMADGRIDTTKDGIAVPSAKCGDSLILRAKYVSGEMDFFELLVEFTIP
jgi:hypothetical protein